MLLNIVDQIDAFAPWLAPRRQSWSQRDKQLDALYRAGSICFVMQKMSSSLTCDKLVRDIIGKRRKAPRTTKALSSR